MTTVDLSSKGMTLQKLLKLAQKGPVLVRDKAGKSFMLSSSDGFDSEVELLRRNHALQGFLDERFRSKKTIPISEIETELSKRKSN